LTLIKFKGINNYLIKSMVWQKRINNNTEEKGDTIRILASFIAVFTLSFSFFVVLGMVLSHTNNAGEIASLPDDPTAIEGYESIVGAASAALPQSYVEPVRVVIESVGIDFEIINPQSRDVTILDRALMEGVVHYPGSGSLEENTNIFLFGHSSHLPEVHNPAFQAFNNLEKASVGDIIRVQSESAEYRYEVRVVLLTDANDALVSLSDKEKQLTLSTCNSFGAQTERFVVEADFIGKYPLVNI